MDIDISIEIKIDMDVDLDVEPDATKQGPNKAQVRVIRSLFGPSFGSEVLNLGTRQQPPTKKCLQQTPELQRIHARSRLG